MDNIITILPIDKQGRVILTRYFGSKDRQQQPEYVAVRFNSKTKELIITKPTNKERPCPVDSQGRVFIDANLRHEFFKRNKIYLVIDEETQELRLFSAD